MLYITIMVPLNNILKTNPASAEFAQFLAESSRALQRLDCLESPCRIPLPQGEYAIVDAWNYEWLNLYKWSIHIQPRQMYAYRTIRIPRMDWPDCEEKWESISLPMHRCITNCPGGFEVDHINHNGLDNKECNLRICTKSQNQGNRRKTNSDKVTSRYKGVSKCLRTGHWIVHFRECHIGTYRNEAQAAKAYDELAINRFGEFALTNF